MIKDIEKRLESFCNAISIEEAQDFTDHAPEDIRRLLKFAKAAKNIIKTNWFKHFDDCDSNDPFTNLQNCSCGISWLQKTVEELEGA